MQYKKDITKLKNQEIIQMEVGETKIFEYDLKIYDDYAKTIKRLIENYNRDYLISRRIGTGITVKRFK